MILPKALEELIEKFMRYPGVGRKTAERYAMFTLNRMSDEDVEDFGKILMDTKKSIHNCPICGHLTDEELCYICQNTERDKSIIMVVETPQDVFSIEKAHKYNGMYHVLNGVISPVDGVGPDDINLKSLWDRVASEKVKEVIIATSSTQEGETTSMYIKKVLENVEIVVSRIGYGVPVGLNLEYADDLTLSKAIENRKKL